MQGIKPSQQFKKKKKKDDNNNKNRKEKVKKIWGSHVGEGLPSVTDF
jgi:hypothetical protein